MRWELLYGCFVGVKCGVNCGVGCVEQVVRLIVFRFVNPIAKQSKFQQQVDRLAQRTFLPMINGALSGICVYAEHRRCVPQVDYLAVESLIVFNRPISFEPGLAARLAAHTLHSHTASTLLLTQLSSLLDHEFQLLDARIVVLLFG